MKACCVVFFFLIAGLKNSCIVEPMFYSKGRLRVLDEGVK